MAFGTIDGALESVVTVNSSECIFVQMSGTARTDAYTLSGAGCENVASDCSYGTQYTEWYTTAAAQEAAAPTGVYSLVRSGGLGYSAATPAYDTNAAVVGVWLADLQLGALSSRLQTLAVGLDGVLFLASEVGG